MPTKKMEQSWDKTCTEFFEWKIDDRCDWKNLGEKYSCELRCANNVRTNVYMCELMCECANDVRTLEKCATCKHEKFAQVIFPLGKTAFGVECNSLENLKEFQHLMKRYEKILHPTRALIKRTNSFHCILTNINLQQCVLYKKLLMRTEMQALSIWYSKGVFSIL